MPDFLARLQSALTRPPRSASEGGTLPAAVLVPLYQADGVWRLVFTLRTDHVESHKGQVSFPGGRADPEDPDRVATALREAEEEIGLLAEAVTVLGQLDEVLTVTGYRVAPVVGLIPWPYAFTPSQQEVSEVFSVPFDWLADPANVEIRYHTLQPGNRRIPVDYYRAYEGKVIWGATARILLNLFARLGLRP